MLFLLTFFAFFALSARKLGNKYPIDRDFCVVNIDGYQYSFMGMGNRRMDKFKPANENYTYFIRYCKELTKEDLGIDTDIDLSDVYAARCDQTHCEALITENSWDWTFYDANNKTNGVIYYASGEPIKISDITYYTFDVQFKAVCDPTQTSYDHSARYIFANIDENEAQLQIIFESPWGCGQDDQHHMPTPTPQPFKPNCDYTDRYDPDTSYGIDLRLGNMNGGPYGIRSVNLSVNKGFTNAVMFYQPCERMDCPPGYKCLVDREKYNLSSAWFCDYGTHQCESYGTVKDEKQYIYPLADILDGVNLTLKHENLDKMVSLVLSCDRFVPMNHIIFGHDATKQDNILTIKGRSQNVCVVPMPDPTPPAEKCHFEGYNDYQKSTITLNLVDHDKTDMVGWVKDVTINGKEKATLYYEPCDNVFCPKDAFCEGDEDATVYLCQQVDGKPNCLGYGLLNNTIGMYLKSSYDITEGVRVDYSADIGRVATINWRCDSSLPKNKITLPETVTVDKKELSFNVYASSACGSGNPKPRPAWHPPRPTIPASPTPTPQPSVNPTDVYVINDTHYILTPLQSYKQEVFRGDLQIVSQSNVGTVYAEFHPWDFLPCPRGYDCGGVVDSNFWACWLEDDGTKYCHSIGDVRILNDMQPITKASPDEGVELTFGGVWGLDTHFDIECNLKEDNSSIPFDKATTMAYSTTKNGTIFRAFLDSGAVCPRKFEDIPNPQPSPRVTPAPDYAPKYVYRSPINSAGYGIEIDLTKLKSVHTELITVGIFPHYQRNTYRYYPVAPGPAPDGYEVLDTDRTTANVWRCYKSSTAGQKNVCHTCGDSTINLNYQLVKPNDLMGGLSIEYSGGYGGFRAHVQLICNTSIPGNEIDFDDVGFFQPQVRAPIIFAHTALICPKKLEEPDEIAREKVTGGAVFLTVLIAALAFYLSVGVMVEFVRNGKLAFPNTELWENFFDCVASAAIFIVSCGKRSSTDASLYEKTI